MRSGSRSGSAAFTCARILFSILIATCLPMAGPCATPGCAVPDFVVPIGDLDSTLAQCTDELRSDPARGVTHLRGLLMGWTCEQQYERSARLRERFECLAQRTGATPDSGPVLDWRAFGPGQCPLARRTLEWAARRGNGEAFFELYEAGLSAHWAEQSGYPDGDCAPGLPAAVGYLEAAAALDVARAKEELAAAIMAHVDRDAYLALGDVFASGHVLTSQYLGEASRRATREDALHLLESAAQTGYPSTLWLLTRGLAGGFWGPDRDAEALAWAAIRAARDDDALDEPFATLYASAYEAVRRRACERIGDITRDDIDFRYVPDEIRNPLMLRCVDSAAIVRDAKCLDRAALDDIERTIEPLVSRTPECADWAIAATTYAIEPAGTASIEALRPLPAIDFPD